MRRGLVEVSGKLHVEEPKTSASRRTIAIPAWLGEELAFHLRGHDTQYVFTAPRGGPLRRSGFRSRVWVPATVRADLTGVRFHDLRHTHAAWRRKSACHSSNPASKSSKVRSGIDRVLRDCAVSPKAAAPCL